MLRKQRPELLSQCRPTSFLIFYFGFWPTMARRNPCNYMLVEIHPPFIKKKSYSFLELCHQIFIGVVGRQKNIWRRDFNRHYKRDRDFPCTKDIAKWISRRYNLRFQKGNIYLYSLNKILWIGKGGEVLNSFFKKKKVPSPASSLYWIGGDVKEPTHLSQRVKNVPSGVITWPCVHKFLN